MSYARHLPVLMYHHVSDKPGQITLSPRTFRAQMKWLAESGWKIVTAAEVEAFYHGARLPRKSVMLTFDAAGWITGCRFFRCCRSLICMRISFL